VLKKWEGVLNVEHLWVTAHDPVTGNTNQSFYSMLVWHSAEGRYLSVAVARAIVVFLIICVATHTLKS